MGMVTEFLTKIKNDKTQTFICTICKGKGKKPIKTSKTMYIWHHDNINDTICNGCGGELMAKGIPRTR